MKNRDINSILNDQVTEDFLLFDEQGIYYQDFVGYLQKPFASRNLNVNSKGFRCPEFTLKKMTDCHRVLMLGSSALFGWLNTDSETISYYLQEHLNTNQAQVEVLNLGVRSYKIMNELNLLYRLNLDLEFDAIVVFDGFNDIFSARRGEVFEGYWSINEFINNAWENKMNGNHSWFLKQAKLINKQGNRNWNLKKILGLEILGVKLNRFIDSGTHRIEKSYSGPKVKEAQYPAARKLYLQHVDYLINFAELYQKKILFFHQPCLYVTQKELHNMEKAYFEESIQDFFLKVDISLDQFKIEYKKQIDDLASLCNRTKVKSIDTFGLFDNLKASDHIFSDYCHLTGKGNQLAANAIYSSINEWF